MEICKALSSRADILILDEPTSSLSDSEVEQLFEIVERLRDQGIAVVGISHRLNEVMRLADRVTVLRDGKLVGTVERRELTIERIIHMMVGRELTDLYGAAAQRTLSTDIALEARQLSGTRFQDVNLVIHGGEILGIDRSHRLWALGGWAEPLRPSPATERADDPGWRALSSTQHE